MMTKKTLFSFILALTCIFVCKCQSNDKGYVLTKEEQAICDKFQIDASIVRDIREFNKSKIEAFHYSLSKNISQEGENGVDPILLKGLVFPETNAKSYNLVFSLKDRLKAKGYTIFLLENNFNIDKKLDNIGVLKTTDKYQVLKEIETDGINHGLTNDGVISLIKTFDKKYALELIGASGDWCEFVIHKEPKDWVQLARDINDVCPDVIDQGSGSIESLADEMKKSKRLYLWWD